MKKNMGGRLSCTTKKDTLTYTVGPESTVIIMVKERTELAAEGAMAKDETWPFIFATRLWNRFRSLTGC